MATMEKKGMPTGLFVTHPLTGALVEVWVGNYVLVTYGDGAVMGVPAHDERDFAFAKEIQCWRSNKSIGHRRQDLLHRNAWEEWYADKEGGKTLHQFRQI
jgi:leucyl-tRNA synthetase